MPLVYLATQVGRFVQVVPAIPVVLPFQVYLGFQTDLQDLCLQMHLFHLATNAKVHTDVTLCLYE